MIEVTQTEFEKIVANAIDSLPEEHLSKLDNVAIVIEDEPNVFQRQKANLLQFQTLFGLYEGIPQYKRGNGYSLVLPDKITIFKGPLTRSVDTREELQKLANNVVWHEVAHHYGLGHARIRELEKK